MLPLLHSLSQQNLNSYKLVDLLQAHNLAAPSNSEDDCAYLENSIQSWLRLAAVPQPESMFENVQDTYILWAQLLPVRCDFQRDDGVITFCEGQSDATSWESVAPATCEVWDDLAPLSAQEASPDYFAGALSLRWEGIRVVSNESLIDGSTEQYQANVLYNYNPSVSLV